MNLKKEFNDLVTGIKDLAFYKNENVKQARELIVVNKEFAFEKEEKLRLTAALRISTQIENKASKKDEENIAHLAAIVESSEDAIISESMNGIIKSWNRGSEKMFGYSANHAIGKNISLIIPPHFVDEEEKIIEKIRNNENIDNYETVRSRKGGEQFYVSLTISPLKNRTGSIIGVSKIARDITIRKKAEAALILANKELAFQNDEKEKRASELIIANRELAFQNKEKEKRAAELMLANSELAFQNEEKENRASELIIANKELAFQNKEKENRASELIIANQELAFQNTEKEKRAAELMLANKELAFQNEEKQQRSEELSLANNDLKIIEKQLQASNKELEAFSYSVSHDLRAPLRAIDGFSTILKEDFNSKLNAEGNKIIDIIIENAQLMSELIDNLLSFSKMARLEAIIDSINMNTLVEKCVTEAMLSETPNKYDITINEVPSCTGDAAMLKQVWVNLISNAFKYSSKRECPIIEIGALPDRQFNVYYVKDNGTGFDMQYANNLFEVFHRLHTQEEFEGTGLGLALAKRIVNKHGGKIWALSTLDEGATFYFSIPKMYTNGRQI